MRPAHDDPTPRKIDVAELLRRARTAQAKAYAPYSRFRVGASVLLTDGRVFDSANVENASYSLTACAEANAIRQMAATGRVGEIEAVAVAGDGAEALTPCGACRQIIFEFGPRAEVYSESGDGTVTQSSITELLPGAFGPQRLATGQSQSSTDPTNDAGSSSLFG